jgi:hypothetical protein
MMLVDARTLHSGASAVREGGGHAAVLTDMDKRNATRPRAVRCSSGI